MALHQLIEFGDLVEAILTTMEVIDPNPQKNFNVGRITVKNINLYHLNDLLIIPLTEPFQCSFMELAATDGPQDPKWFISHWWGTPFFDSLRMLKFHCKIRDLPHTTFYWMCTFANNQHNLGELASASVLDTPFAKAIMLPSCAGTIALMTERTAMPFTRIWCVLEDYVSLITADDKQQLHLFDVASIIPDDAQEVSTGEWNKRQAAPLTDKGDGAFYDNGGDEDDECWFPAEVSFKGVDVKIREANASNQSDKKNILRLIGKSADDVNMTLRRRFARQALYNWCATAYANAEKVEWLLNSGLLGGDTQKRKAVSQEVLVDACEYTDGSTHAVIDILLQASADLNQSNEKGTATPLKHAVQHGSIQILEKLLRAKADMNKAYDASGRTPLDIANDEYDSDDDVWTVLQKYGYE